VILPTFDAASVSLFLPRLLDEQSNAAGEFGSKLYRKSKVRF